MSGATTVHNAGNRVTKLRPDLAILWVQSAQPGSQLCYHEGWTAVEAGDAINDALRVLQGQGYIYFKQAPKPRRTGFFYLIERSSRPWGKPLDPRTGKAAKPDHFGMRR